MARKGNPISVRLDLNRSSDSSWFSEGDRESHRMGQPFPSVYPVFEIKKKAWEDVADVRGADTTSSKARRPLEDTQD